MADYMKTMTAEQRIEYFERMRAEIGQRATIAPSPYGGIQEPRPVRITDVRVNIGDTTARWYWDSKFGRYTYDAEALRNKEAFFTVSVIYLDREKSTASGSINPDVVTVGERVRIPKVGDQVRLKDGVMWGPILLMRVRRVFKNGWVECSVHSDSHCKVMYEDLDYEDEKGEN